MKLFTTILRLNFSLAILIFLIPKENIAQQIPFLNTYIYSPEYYNPAAMGHGDGHITLIHRRQWLDVESTVAPKSYVLNVDLSNRLPFAKRIGVGLGLQSDQTHIFKRTNIDLSFSFHLVNTKTHHFSLGATAGLLSQQIDFGNISVGTKPDVALYSGNSTGSVFSGGPGLAYDYKTDVNQFSFNLALPQLFTGELNYEDELNRTFDNRFHILTGIRYRTKLAALSLEPSILYRSTNAEEGVFGKSTVDVNVRALFLNDRFWVDAGTRLNGNALLFGAGINIEKKIDIQAVFEYHNVLGLSYEAAVVYCFEERIKEDEPPKPDRIRRPRTPKPDRSAPAPQLTAEVVAKLTDEKAKIESTRSALAENRFMQIEGQLRASKNTFALANYTGLTETEKSIKVRKAEESMLDAKTKLDDLLGQTQTIFYAAWRSKQTVDIAENKNIESREINRIYNSIIEQERRIDDKIRALNNDYLSLNNRISDFKELNGFEQPVVDLIRSKNVVQLNEKLAADLNKIPGAVAATVVVEQNDELKIVYTFPNTSNAYVLEKGRETNTIIVSHITGQLRQMQEKGIAIEAVKLKILLQDDASDVNAFPSTFPYLGEFGERVQVPVTLLDVEEETSSDITRMFEQWKPNTVLDLTYLKLFGIKDYMAKQGFSSTPIRFEVTSPNYDKINAQTFEVEIIIK